MGTMSIWGAQLGGSSGSYVEEMGRNVPFFKKNNMRERERGKRSNPFEAHSFMRALSLGTIHQR